MLYYSYFNFNYIVGVLFIKAYLGVSSLRGAYINEA
jgi:hypothetical protein